MKREIIKIDEDKCTGCGLCIPNCHEGALQIIEGKARFVSELMCDGLGACIGYCPEDAISIEEREAEQYNEVQVIRDMTPKGLKTIRAHFQHLKDHNQSKYLDEGFDYLESIQEKLDFDLEKLKEDVFEPEKKKMVPFDVMGGHMHGGSCPGSAARKFSQENTNYNSGSEIPSALSHWPIQMHLINPSSSHFIKSDLVLAADCVAFSFGNFHSKFLSGKTLAIACPKLDKGTDQYVAKLIQLINEAEVNTITVLMMEVPCCGGLIQMIKKAMLKATRKVPVKAIIISIQGAILSEEWL
ncbi:MAG: 4Fe-4S ferredoxin [Marinilabiliales bacterium]|nr:MAG: 4Fe-4S ferredoxin [Marinilabiliales bacterium]